MYLIPTRNINLIKDVNIIIFIACITLVHTYNVYLIWNNILFSEIIEKSEFHFETATHKLINEFFIFQYNTFTNK